MKQLHFITLSLTTLLLSLTAGAQVYNMSNTSVTTCSGLFYDSGGSGNVYGSGETTTMTFCSGMPGEPIQFVFTAFATEIYYDSLIIYNGPTVNAPILAVLTGNVAPAPVISSNPANCLTFRFVSDIGIQYSGWSATILCGNTPPPPATPCHGAPMYCTGTNYSIVADTGRQAHTGPYYDCVASQPNPTWFKVQIAQAGNLNLNISTDSNDVDFIVWGPFSNGIPCDGLVQSKVVDCSFSPQSVEYVDIPNALVGQTYILCITNYENLPTNIYVVTNANSTARTVCDSNQCSLGINGISMSACNSGDSITVAANIYATTDSQQGTLTVVSSFADTVVYTAPFAAAIQYITQVPLTADSISIQAYFSHNNACAFQATYAVVLNPVATTVSAQPTNTANQPIGSATVAATGGIPPYTYLWSNGQTTATAQGLVQGMYHVTVSDALHCTVVDSVLVQAAVCNIMLNATAAYCHQGSDDYYANIYYNITGAPAQGDLVLTVNGTNQYYVPAPYSANNFQYTTPGLSGTGSIHVSAYFSNDTSCTATATATTLIEAVSATVSTTDASSPTSYNGRAVAVVTSGLSPYTFIWSEGGTQHLIQGLPPGTYQVTVTDARGCYTVVAATVGSVVGISQPNSEVQLSIVPNPATDVVQIQFSKYVNATGYIYGTDGKLHYSFDINGTTETVNIAQLPKGVYVIHVKQSATNTTSYSRLLKY